MLGPAAVSVLPSGLEASHLSCTHREAALAPSSAAFLPGRSVVRQVTLEAESPRRL